MTASVLLLPRTMLITKTERTGKKWWETRGGGGGEYKLFSCCFPLTFFFRKNSTCSELCFFFFFRGVLFLPSFLSLCFSFLLSLCNHFPSETHAITTPLSNYEQREKDQRKIYASLFFIFTHKKLFLILHKTIFIPPPPRRWPRGTGPRSRTPPSPATPAPPRPHRCPGSRRPNLPSRQQSG